MANEKEPKENVNVEESKTSEAKSKSEKNEKPKDASDCVNALEHLQKQN